MSKNTNLTVLPPENSDLAPLADFDAARHYMRAAKAAGGMMALSMIFAGVELLRLHKVYAVKRGGDRSNPTSHLGLPWAEIVKREMAISDEWARKLMALADVAKKRVKNLDAADLMSHPLLSLPPERLAEIEKATADLIDGRTGSELMLEFGIIKKPSLGGGGGATGGGAQYKELSLDEEGRAKVWPAQHALGTLCMDARLETWLNVLPLNPPGADEPLTDTAGLAALVPLEDALHTLLKAVETAIKHKKEQLKRR